MIINIVNILNLFVIHFYNVLIWNGNIHKILTIVLSIYEILLLL